MAILVANYHQPLDNAWRFTMDEFIMVVDFKSAARSFTASGWDDDKAEDFKRHLKRMGIEGVD